MPDSTPRLGVTIPVGSEADNVPGVLMLAFSEMEQAGVPIVATTQERDSEYAGDTPGQLVTSASGLYIKQASGWATVYADTGWIRQDEFEGGWTSGQAVYYRVKNGICYWEGALRPPAGYAEDVALPVMTVPTVARPRLSRRFPGVNDTGVIVPMRYSGADGKLYATITSAGSQAWITLPNPYPVD